MIASVRGRLEHVGAGEVVVDVGGVGLRLAVTTGFLQQSLQVGHPVFLHAHMVVREDAISLYGFATLEERGLFEVLLQTDGVGPRLAMAILSSLSPELLRTAVTQGQVDVLTRVPGIGRKTAEKLIFHLKDKLGAPSVGVAPPLSESDTDVMQALTALGYSVVEAQTALQSIPADASPETEERIRLALQHFTRP